MRIFKRGVRPSFYWPEGPENPEYPENPESPESPESPEYPENPEYPESPEHPEGPGDAAEDLYGALARLLLDDIIEGADFVLVEFEVCVLGRRVERVEGEYATLHVLCYHLLDEHAGAEDHYPIRSPFTSNER